MNPKDLNKSDAGLKHKKENRMTERRRSDILDSQSVQTTLLVKNGERSEDRRKIMIERQRERWRENKKVMERSEGGEGEKEGTKRGNTGGAVAEWSRALH